MGLGVLEPQTAERVPGTVHVGQETEEQLRLTSRLKHGTGRYSHIVLVPQPSESPNDPLNWPYWYKCFLSVFLAAGTAMLSGTLNFVNASNNAYAVYLNTSVTKLSRSISVALLMIGVSVVISSPAARIWGKRPVLLVSQVIAVIGYIVVIANDKSITHLYVGRAIHGLGMAGLEYLVTSTIGDLFYVHQRALHMALWHFGLGTGNTCGQVIGAQIVARQNWRWAFSYAIIVIGVYTIVFFFVVPETSYIRPVKYNTDFYETLVPERESNSAIDSSPSSDNGEKATRVRSVDITDVEEQTSPVESERKISYLQTLKVYDGRFTDDSFLKSLITPFSVYMLPAVVWATYAMGCDVGFSASFSVSLSSIFTVAPYNFTVSQVGLTVLGSWIGCTLGNLLPGPLLDWLVKFMSRKNRGIYEPEFRLVLLIPAFILGVGAFWGFGLSLHAKLSWVAPVFFYGLATFALEVVSLISNTYIIDCHRAQAQQGYAAVTFGRSIFSFSMTFVISDWIARDGIVTVFFVVGTLYGIGCLFGMYLYVYGKRIRLAVHKNGFIQRHIGQAKVIE